MIDFVLQWEVVKDRQGNVIAEDDPDDPGGLTKYGIDQRSHPNVEIQSLTADEAKDIYYNDYYLGSGADKLPDGIRTLLLDGRVNDAHGRAIQVLPGTVRR